MRLPEGGGNRIGSVPMASRASRAAGGAPMRPHPRTQDPARITGELLRHHAYGFGDLSAEVEQRARLLGITYQSQPEQ